ncbi:hypothetical protein [Sediminibacter sp. Hel_I_10]|uniref:hypothetical protein n=1 Tax=Sediminibacter sp. Hel_I_10 TaxID=1392490 RepID=UPI0006901937|nr:hypothetical protein [Sediminibacter sp. Hel_I_10]
MPLWPNGNAILKPEEITYLLQHPQHISKAQTAELEETLNDYPYFQALRALHLKGLKLKQSFKYNQALKTTAAFTTDRSILFDYITSEAFNQNNISLNIKHNSEHLKSIEVNEHDDISIDKKVTYDDALKEHIKNSEGVLDPHLFENKPLPEVPSNEPLLNVDTQNIETTPEKILSLGQPLDFNKNETHSFAEWLKITSFKPIEREASSKVSEEEEKEEKASQTGSTVDQKFELINKFLKSNPKIVPSKESPKIDLTKVSNTSNDELMTETLARIYLEQKNYDKAIQSYKILSLKYPEKSGFFADQIKAVKQLQENNTKN